ncbi:hypothetical protein NX021_19215 [Cytobacillus firmus]|nr:hypothetical protein [Cytobacillus firmus]
MFRFGTMWNSLVKQLVGGSREEVDLGLDLKVYEAVMKFSVAGDFKLHKASMTTISFGCSGVGAS